MACGPELLLLNYNNGQIEKRGENEIEFHHAF